MKSITKVLFLFAALALLGAPRLFAEVKITNSGNQISSYSNADMRDGKVVVMGEAGYQEGRFKPYRVILYDGEWRELSSGIGKDIQDTALISSSGAQVRFDSTGSIWVSGIALYKYNLTQKKWTKYFIDDEYNGTRNYEQFCVDKFNNLWITASIYNKNKGWSYSELLKFDGTNFNRVLKFNTTFSFSYFSGPYESNAIAALPDGRICVHRILGDAAEKEPEKHWEDIYLINQDGAYERIKAHTPSGKDFDDYNKNIAYICPETESKIWFCFAEFTYYPHPDSMKTCCSGLSLYENGEWTALNESNGLDIIRENTYRVIYRIAKLNAEKYLVLGTKRIYIMDTQNNLRSLHLEKFLNSASFESANNYFASSNGIEYLRELHDDNTPMPPKIIHLHADINGETTLVLEKGILRFPTSLLLSTNDITAADEKIEVYPNPAAHTIKIKSSRIITMWELYDAMGRKTLQGENVNNEVNIETVSSGAYFLRLIDDKAQSEVISFIKN